MRVKADVHIGPDRVQSIIEKHYGLQVHSLTKVRAVYKVETSRGTYGFKNAIELPDLPFVIHCLRKIKENGFSRIPDFLSSKDGKWLVYEDGEAYFMEEWLDLKEVPVDSFPYWQKIAQALADFHQASQTVPPDYTNHIRYFFGMRQRFLEKMYRKLVGWRKTASRPIELGLLDFALYRLDKAYRYIKDVPADSIAYTGVWCHGGLQHRNIMLDHQDQVWLIDFETLTFMERVADLAQFLQYHGLKYRWSPSAVQTFLNAYNARLDVPISEEERKWFLSYFTFTKRMASRLSRYFVKRNRTPKDFMKCKETFDKEFKKEEVLLQVHKRLLK